MKVYTLTCVETYNDELMATETAVYKSRKEAITFLRLYIRNEKRSFQAEYGNDAEIIFNSGDGWREDYKITNAPLNTASMLVYPLYDHPWELTYYLKEHDI